MRTVVINLASRVDRREEMERQLSRVGWHAEFFSAVKPTSPGGFVSVGARGCFESHLSILRRAHADNVERILILEDDLNFHDDFLELWRAAIDNLEQHGWSFFYPGHVLTSLPLGLNFLPHNQNVLCSHFLMINGPSIGLVVRELEAIIARPPGHPRGGPMHVDGAYSTIRALNENLITYAYEPSLGRQRPSRTDIAELKWYDRLHALAGAVRLIRTFKKYRLSHPRR